MQCEKPDFIYPMLADVFYPAIDQSPYGDVRKSWMLDKTIAGNFVYAGSKTKQEVVVNPSIIQDQLILGRVKTDIRVSDNKNNNSITNVLITNIQDINGNPIYVETSGVRMGKSTLFEVASCDPQVGPFGSVEFYQLILRRSENQGTNV